MLLRQCLRRVRDGGELSSQDLNNEPCARGTRSESVPLAINEKGTAAMKSPKTTATVNIVRYLLLLLTLDTDGGGVRSVDLADRVGVKKPSVYQAIRTLLEKGLAEQERYARINLTETGRETAVLYLDCYNRMLPRIAETIGLSEEICRFAVYEILSRMNRDELSAYALAKQRTEGRRTVGSHDLERTTTNQNELSAAQRETRV